MKQVSRNVRKIIVLVLMLSLCFTMVPFQTNNNAYGMTKTITSFENPDNQFVFFEGNPSLEEVLCQLPSTIDVHLDGQEEVTQIPVSWEALGGYDRYNYYSFVFLPKWNEGYILADGLDEELSVPTITAFRKEKGVEPPVDEDEGTLLDTIGQLAGMYSYGATNEEIIYNYLTGTMGLNMAAACGVLANMYAESGLKANNLENKYNESLGMTDTEYTKKVNDKTYPRKKFVGDNAGYGLCQWTFGRKGKLYDFAKEYCKKKGISFNIANIKMQLEFFKQEVQEERHMPTWNTLSTVPNLEMGAYLAAFVMCHNFEVPADTGSKALSRGKSCLTAFWDEYSGKASSFEKNNYFAICGVRYPTKIVSSMPCNGYIVSNKGIAKVVAKVIDKSTSKAKYSYTDTIDTEKKTVICYDFIKTENKDEKTIDNFAFGSLANGSYTYTVKATDVTGKTLTISKNFTVKDSYSANSTKFASVYMESSTLKLSKYTSPEVVQKGEAFEGTGKVTSNYNISYVSVGIKDKEGNILQKKTASPESKNFDISAIAKKLDFTALKGGQYTYYVYAKDQLKSAYVLTQSFGINSKSAAGFNYPKSIATGKDFQIKGTVTSDIPITKIYARVVNSSGKVVTSKTVAPNTKKYDLSKLNNYLDFSKCQKGVHYYRVTATDEAGELRVISKKFTVYTASTLRITDYLYPKELKYKTGFSIGGMLRSNYYLKKVTIKILNSEGKEIQKVEKDLSKVNRLKYSLANLDKYVKFGSLKRGTYRYKVVTIDTKATKVLLNRQFTVK